MCGVCGCGPADGNGNGTNGNDHHHDAHEHHEHNEHNDHWVHDESVQGARIVQIEQDIMNKNKTFAQQNEVFLRTRKTLCVNLISSPGTGKTTLLSNTLQRLGQAVPAAVIVGDQQTSRDADRITAMGSIAHQINTGRGCHLDAHMVGHALMEIQVPKEGYLFIENVGNLVCPSEFDLGEMHKIVLLSVTEGEDKPIKYSGTFAKCDLLLLTKTDLLPHLDFNVEQCIEFARRVNPDLEIIQISSKSGEGFAQWLQWLENKRQAL